jgi:hypothetical protein
MTAVGVSAGTLPATDKTQWTRWAGLSGPIFGVILAASVFMTAGIPNVSNPAKVQAWSIKHHGLLSGAAVLTMASVVVGLYFLVWLHSHLTRSERGWMETLYLVGAVILGVSGGLAAGVNASMGNDAKHLSTGSLQLMASLNQNLNYPMTCAGLALMFLAAGFLIRRTAVLPGWLAWPCWLFALTAFSFVLGFVALFGTVLFVIVAGIYTTVRPPVEN